MEETVSLHFQEFVSVFGLLDSSLELDEFAAGWFNANAMLSHLLQSVRFKLTLGSQGGTFQSTFGQGGRGTLCQWTT